MKLITKFWNAVVSFFSLSAIVLAVLAVLPVAMFFAMMNYMEGE